MMEDDDGKKQDSLVAQTKTTSSNTRPFLTRIREMENENDSISIPSLMESLTDIDEDRDATTVVTNLTSTKESYYMELEPPELPQQQSETQQINVEAVEKEETMKEEATVKDVSKDTNKDSIFYKLSHNEPIQIIPTWLISGDDITQMMPEPCHGPIHFVENSCLCQRMQKEEEECGNNSIIATSSVQARHPCTVGTTIKMHQEVHPFKLRARAPLEAPSPKKPGESNFLEEDMMDLLETV